MVKVDQEKCIGCGACESICPASFKLEGDKAHFTGKESDCVKDAKESRPVGAISL